MAVVLGLKSLSKTFAGNFCLLRCIGPTACTYDAVRYYTPDRASGKPAKPPSAFLLYMKSVRPQVRQEHPEIKTTEEVKLMAEMYRNLDMEQLKDLRLRAEEQMTEYKKEMKEYLDGLTTEEKNQIQKEKATKKKIRLMKRIRKEQKELNKPKKFRTAYLQFLAECWKEGNLESTNPQDAAREIAARWKTMTDSEKEGYQERAKKEKAEYEKNLAAWEAQMIEEKKYHLVREKQLYQITGIRRKQRKRVVSKKKARRGVKKTTRKRKTAAKKKSTVAKKESKKAEKESTVAEKESTAPKRKSRAAKTEPSDSGSETGKAKTPRRKAAVSKKQSKVDVATLSDSDSD